MLGFRVRGWQIWPAGGYFIICRDVHLLHGGHVLECRCVESVPAAPLGVLSRANGPLTAVLRPVCRRLCNHCYCTCCTHDADRGDGGHNTLALTP